MGGCLSGHALRLSRRQRHRRGRTPRLFLRAGRCGRNQGTNVQWPGEVMSLRPSERAEVTRIARDAVNAVNATTSRSVKVISGVSAEASQEAVDHALAAKEAGTDAILLMPPHHWLRFGRKSDTAVGFFEDVADGCEIPIVVHQYPAWTKAGYSLAEMLEIVRIPEIVMIKMGTRDLARWRFDYEQLKSAAERVTIVTCHDEFLLPTLVDGADGALIGFAGFVPELMVELIHAALDDDLVRAKRAWLMTRQAKTVLNSPASLSSKVKKPESTIEFLSQPGTVVVTADGHPLATYYFTDPEIPRPYLAHMHAPDGIQVTRNHPPQPGDSHDHADLHPGIFLAFGDLSGHDYLRLIARVVHSGFQQQPTTNGNQGHFVVNNRYLSTDGTKTICLERCQLRFTAEAHVYRIDWESTFWSPDADFYFGDQEEMGLGVRVASAIREKGGSGRLLNSEGLVGAQRTWGQLAPWCDYSGVVGGEHVGVTIVPAPYNVRPSWWHNRDYGVFVANMFGSRSHEAGTTKSDRRAKR